MNKTLLALGALSLTGCNTIEKFLNKPNSADWNHVQALPPVLQYQAWDPSFPEVSPLFNTQEEAEQYALENNMNGDGTVTGHSYTVREVNYKYEVRIQNDSIDDQLYTSNDINDALNYVEEYKHSHSDIYVYDIVSGATYVPTTP